MPVGCSIHPSATFFYNIPDKCLTTTPKEHKANGSDKSMQRIRRCLSYFYLFASERWAFTKEGKQHFKFRLAFITLTLSSEQKHTDDYIKRHMLEPFLKWAFRRGGDTHYVWKAECQDNGNIHFHITFNGFIHWTEIRRKWNHLQWKHGYIAENADPNSTDVHSVKKEKGFVGYMSKYMGKTEQARKQKEIKSLFPFAASRLEYEMGMASVACVGVPYYKRRVEGKHWAADRRLLACKVNIRVEDEDTYGLWQECYNDHLRLMNSNRIVGDHMVMYVHEQSITKNTQLTPRIADMFCSAYNKYNS